MKIEVNKLAQLIDAEVIGNGSLIIHGAGTIEDGCAGEIGFLADSHYVKYASNTGLSALIVSQPVETKATQLIVKDVKLAWQNVARQFSMPIERGGIAAKAIIHPEAKLGKNVTIAAGAVIEAGVDIGDDCYIGANAVVEQGVQIGSQGWISAGVRLLRGTSIGKQVFIDSGAVVGSRGFGYAHTGKNWLPVAQLGGVVIGNNVDVGANTTIDCGAIRDTVIEDGVKLDNLIQVGHNVHIGAHTIIAGNCVIAGSVHFGSHCVVGGASVFAGHITICDGAQFTGHSSVSKSITKPGVYCSALTVMPHRQWARFVAKLKLFGKEK